MAQLVDSKQQKLSMEAIIKIAAQNTKADYSPEQIMGSIYKELTMNGSIVVQIGNTVFLMHRSDKDPTVAFMRALNADAAQNYLDNSVKFADEVYNTYKIDTIVTEFNDPTIINVFAYIGKMNPKDRGYTVQKSKDGKTYRITAKVGPELGITK